MKRRQKTSPSVLQTVDELTQKNIDTIARLEETTRSNATPGDRLADHVANFCGSTSFVIIHGLWFAGWIGYNIAAPSASRFDPYPFQLLTLIVSLEAIFLSAFIMISQNRQAKISERRSHLDLQINLLSEQENTKMIDLLQKIALSMGVAGCSDGEVAAMAEAVEPDKLLNQIEKTIEKAAAAQSPAASPPPR